MYKIILIAFTVLFTFTVFVFNSKTNKITPETIQKFKEFAKTKAYTPDEMHYRLHIFANNKRIVNELNKNNDGTIYRLNQFADLSLEEFKTTYLGLLKKNPIKSFPNVNQSNYDMALVDIDWQAKGKVQVVKNQGQCGSCWAFSAVGALESEGAIHGHGLGNFSEQQLVDCSQQYGNHGCKGGLMEQAFMYVKEHGITTESNYPYKAIDQNCKKNSGSFVIKSYSDVPSRDCVGLQSALLKQPISVGVDAEQWQFYSEGIIKMCGKDLNHGVLLVGQLKGVWKIKNSWGTNWGEKGYVRLGAGNTCGLCNEASWPSL